jgi:lipoprotein NlpD
MRGVLRSAGWSLLPAVFLLSACNSVSLSRAPVEDRGGFDPTMGGFTSPPASPSTPSGTTFERVVVNDLPPATGAVASPKVYAGTGTGNADGGQSGAGYHTVKPKETLYSLARLYGQSHKDIARWNNLDNNAMLKIGQVVRVAAPGSVSANTGVAVVTSPAPTAPAPAPSSSKALGVPVAAAVVTAPSTSASTTPAPIPDSAPEISSTGATVTIGNVTWSWPSKGRVIAGFDESKNKGLDIAGNAGDPVLASADGTVVYAASGLRGYGQLIILKHTTSFLTAYAHNRNLLVTENQKVKRGQKIAEMGSSEADRVKLHFEVRRDGKPVDPSRYMPAR